MTKSPQGLSPGSENNLLLPYVTDLEFEVDRLRRWGALFEHTVLTASEQIRQHCQADNPPESGAALIAIAEIIDELATVVAELHQQGARYSKNDRVAAIDIGLMAEEVFRWQQRISGTKSAVLRITTDLEQIEWFPVRLRHILDSLMVNALQNCDVAKGEIRVGLQVKQTGSVYEIRVSDNGMGVTAGHRDDLLELFQRASPGRDAGLGVGLAVVKQLIEQSGGSLTMESHPGKGSCFIASLPIFALKDFI